MMTADDLPEHHKETLQVNNPTANISYVLP